MRKCIALVAHDEKKIVMAEWTNKHKEILKNHNLVGTEGTAEMVRKIADLDVKNRNRLQVENLSEKPLFAIVTSSGIPVMDEATHIARNLN
jgi:hypothetical protein